MGKLIRKLKELWNFEAMVELNNRLKQAEEKIVALELAYQSLENDVTNRQMLPARTMRTWEQRRRWYEATDGGRVPAKDKSVV